MQFGRRKSNPSWMSKASAKVRALWKNPNWVCKQRIKSIKVKIMKASSQRSNGVMAMGRLADKNMKLQDQRVLVTGSTAGIGRETAMLFARRGATVVITGRDTERGAQTVAAIEAEGGRAEFIAADLSDIESVRRLAEQVGEVDVLVNNAAVHK